MNLDFPLFLAKAQMDPGWASGLGTGAPMVGGQIFPGTPAAPEFDWREAGPPGAELVAGAGMPLGMMMAVMKMPWQMTRAEYKKSMPIGDNKWESLYVKNGPINVNVVRNPESIDESIMLKTFNKIYPDAPPDTIKIRSTIDSQGNKYIWRADQATHGQIEPIINRKYNTSTNQNGIDWPTHSRIVRQALAQGNPVPEEVLADYPDLINLMRKNK